MPTYEYKCESCGHQFEKWQYITEKPLETCPQCGEHVKRLIGTGSGIIFKGSGFYSVDHHSNHTFDNSCTRNSPCCGKEEPCEVRPCQEKK